MARSNMLLVVAVIAGLTVAILFAFTLVGLIGEVFAAAAVVALIGKLTLRALHR